MDASMTRKSFIAGSLVLGAAAAAGAGKASAEEASIETSREVDVDVLVCGAGAAGLAAACAAAQEGVSVVCLEKCSTPFAPGTNYGFANVPEFLEAGAEEYDEIAYIDELTKGLDGMGSPEIYANFVAANPTVGSWMLEMARKRGHEYTITAPLSSVAFTGVYDMMTEELEANGGELVCSMAARQFVVEDGKVVGVVAQNVDTEEYVLYRAAKGVVLATGGYSGNPDMIRKYIPWVDPDTMLQYALNASQGGEDGDGIVMCQEIGARIGDAPHTPEIHFVHGAIATEGVLFVDGLGQRLPDNATCISHEYRAQQVMRHAGHSSWRITDGKEGYPEYIPDGLPEDMWPDYSEPLDDYDTLEDLAAAFGFDTEMFLATIEAWNATVEAGTDELYGTDFSTAMAIDTPPYHAKECKPCNLCMIGGPVISADFEVLGEDYRTIPGLWAVGNCVSGFFGTNYPMDAKFGVNRAFCAVSGYLAGKAAAAAEA